MVMAVLVVLAEKRTDRGEDGKAGSPGWVIIEYGGDI